MPEAGPELTLEPSSESALELRRTEDAVQMIRDLQAAGLETTARQAADAYESTGIELPRLLKEQLRMAALTQQNTDLTDDVSQLLNDWKSAGDRTAASALLHDASVSDAGRADATMLIPMHDAATIRRTVEQMIEQWKTADRSSSGAAESQVAE